MYLMFLEIKLMSWYFIIIIYPSAPTVNKPSLKFLKFVFLWLFQLVVILLMSSLHLAGSRLLLRLVSISLRIHSPPLILEICLAAFQPGYYFDGLRSFLFLIISSNDLTQWPFHSSLRHFRLVHHCLNSVNVSLPLVQNWENTLIEDFTF